MSNVNSARPARQSHLNPNAQVYGPRTTPSVASQTIPRGLATQVGLAANPSLVSAPGPQSSIPTSHSIPASSIPTSIASVADQPLSGEGASAGVDEESEGEVDGDPEEDGEGEGEGEGEDTVEADIPTPHILGLAPIARPSRKATLSELRTALEGLGLDSRGKKETLFKRLMAVYTKQQDHFAAEAAKAKARRLAEEAGDLPPVQQYGSFLCFDVEATCEPGRNNFDYPNEIIEFPVVLLRWSDLTYDEYGRRRRARTLVVVDTFHSYVRPTWRPKLSDFCASLTGISQSKIDVAPTFPQMLIKFEAWLDKWGLRDGDELLDATWATDGPWDLRDFIPKQLHITPTNPPRYPGYLLGSYINIKAGVHAVLSEMTRREAAKSAGYSIPPGRLTTGGYQRRPKSMMAGPNFYLNITGQLEALGLGAFEGRQHSGIDDATNIARILTELARRGVALETNGRLPPARNARQWSWMGPGNDVVYFVPQVPVLGIPVDVDSMRDPPPISPATTATPVDTGPNGIPRGASPSVPSVTNRSVDVSELAERVGRLAVGKTAAH